MHLFPSSSKGEGTEITHGHHPRFTEAERKRVTALLLERYGKLVPIQLADSELQLGVDPADLSLCTTIYWSERGAHFAVFKTGGEHATVPVFLFRGRAIRYRPG